MKKKPTKGGAREGSGRKPTGRVKKPVTYTISDEAKENIAAKAAEKECSASKLVDDWAKKLKTKLKKG